MTKVNSVKRRRTESPQPLSVTCAKMDNSDLRPQASNRVHQKSAMEKLQDELQISGFQFLQNVAPGANGTRTLRKRAPDEFFKSSTQAKLLKPSKETCENPTVDKISITEVAVATEKCPPNRTRARPASRMAQSIAPIEPKQKGLIGLDQNKVTSVDLQLSQVTLIKEDVRNEEAVAVETCPPKRRSARPASRMSQGIAPIEVVEAEQTFLPSRSRARPASRMMQRITPIESSKHTNTLTEDSGKSTPTISIALDKNQNNLINLDQTKVSLIDDDVRTIEKITKNQVVEAEQKCPPNRSSTRPSSRMAQRIAPVESEPNKSSLFEYSEKSTRALTIALDKKLNNAVDPEQLKLSLIKDDVRTIEKFNKNQAAKKEGTCLRARPSSRMAQRIAPVELEQNERSLTDDSEKSFRNLSIVLYKNENIPVVPEQSKVSLIKEDVRTIEKFAINKVTKAEQTCPRSRARPSSRMAQRIAQVEPERNNRSLTIDSEKSTRVPLIVLDKNEINRENQEQPKVSLIKEEIPTIENCMKIEEAVVVETCPPNPSHARPASRISREMTAIESIGNYTQLVVDPDKSTEIVFVVSDKLPKMPLNEEEDPQKSTEILLVCSKNLPKIPLTKKEDNRAEEIESNTTCEQVVMKVEEKTCPLKRSRGRPRLINKKPKVNGPSRPRGRPRIYPIVEDPLKSLVRSKTSTPVPLIISEPEATPNEASELPIIDLIKAEQDLPNLTTNSQRPISVASVKSDEAVSEPERQKKRVHTIFDDIKVDGFTRLFTLPPPVDGLRRLRFREVILSEQQGPPDTAINVENSSSDGTESLKHEPIAASANASKAVIESKDAPVADIVKSERQLQLVRKLRSDTVKSTSFARSTSVSKPKSTNFPARRIYRSLSISQLDSSLVDHSSNLLTRTVFPIRPTYFSKITQANRLFTRKRAMSIDSRNPKSKISFIGPRNKELTPIGNHVKQVSQEMTQPKDEVHTNKFDDCLPHVSSPTTDVVLPHVSSLTTDAVLPTIDVSPSLVSAEDTPSVVFKSSDDTKLKKTSPADGPMILTNGIFNEPVLNTPNGSGCHANYESSMKSPSPIDSAKLSARRINPNCSRPKVSSNFSDHNKPLNSIVHSVTLKKPNILSRNRHNATPIPPTFETQPFYGIPIFSQQLNFIPVDWSLQDTSPKHRIPPRVSDIAINMPNGDDDRKQGSPIILDEVTITVVPKRTNPASITSASPQQTVISPTNSRLPISPLSRQWSHMIVSMEHRNISPGPHPTIPKQSAPNNNRYEDRSPVGSRSVAKKNMSMATHSIPKQLQSVADGHRSVDLSAIVSRPVAKKNVSMGTFPKHVQSTADGHRSGDRTTVLSRPLAKKNISMRTLPNQKQSVIKAHRPNICSAAVLRPFYKMSVSMGTQTPEVQPADQAIQSIMAFLQDESSCPPPIVQPISHNNRLSKTSRPEPIHDDDPFQDILEFIDEDCPTSQNGHQRSCESIPGSVLIDSSLSLPVLLPPAAGLLERKPLKRQKKNSKNKPNAFSPPTLSNGARPSNHPASIPIDRQYPSIPPLIPSISLKSSLPSGYHHPSDQIVNKTNGCLRHTVNNQTLNTSSNSNKDNFSLESLDAIPTEQLFVPDGSFNMDDYL